MYACVETVPLEATERRPEFCREVEPLRPDEARAVHCHQSLDGVSSTFAHWPNGHGRLEYSFRKPTKMCGMTVFSSPLRSDQPLYDISIFVNGSAVPLRNEFTSRAVDGSRPRHHTVRQLDGYAVSGVSISGASQFSSQQGGVALSFKFSKCVTGRTVSLKKRTHKAGWSNDAWWISDLRVDQS